MLEGFHLADQLGTIPADLRDRAAGAKKGIIGGQQLLLELVPAFRLVGIPISGKDFKELAEVFHGLGLVQHCNPIIILSAELFTGWLIVSGEW